MPRASFFLTPIRWYTHIMDTYLSMLPGKQLFYSFIHHPQGLPSESLEFNELLRLRRYAPFGEMARGMLRSRWPSPTF